MDQRRRIDGALFEKMFLGGVANLQFNLEKVNDLNVFPIPDGDTGENMYLTMQGGVQTLDRWDSLGDKATASAQGMLLSARGNSGVILSQLFYGLGEGLKGLEEADIEQFRKAMQEGIKCAYGAVSRPVEGTILTVARESLENAPDAESVEEFIAKLLIEMKKSLENTPNLLAVLKEAGVIDSGGAGLVYIIEGFYKALKGETIENKINANAKQPTLDFSKFNENTVMEFGYCTELLLQLQHVKTDIASFSVEALIAFLESVGDSVVAFQTGTIVKIHVHTLTPWQVLAHCQKFGEYLTVKIENMTLQHNETHVEKEEELAVTAEIKMPKRARRKFATVTVATGEGLKSTFLEMGVDYVIAGGQTNNPSSEDFIKAFEEVNADVIFVLPNNGNVLLSAEQAKNIYKDSNVRVIPTKNIGAGYSALSMIDYEIDDADEIAKQMEESMQGTVTGMVARAVRDANLNGVAVREGRYMGFTDKTMLLCEDTKIEALKVLTEKLGVAEKEYAIVSYGTGVTEEEKENFRSYVNETYRGLELYEIEGGQEVYDFLLIIE